MKSSPTKSSSENDVADAPSNRGVTPATSNFPVTESGLAPTRPVCSGPMGSAVETSTAYFISDSENVFSTFFSFLLHKKKASGVRHDRHPVLSTVTELLDPVHSWAGVDSED